MAVEAERLLINIEASVSRLEREMRKGRQTANRELTAIENRAAALNRNINRQFSGMARSIGASLAGAFSIREASGFIDTATKIENALRVVGLQGESLNKVYGQLYASAQRNSAPLETLVTLYSRVARAQNELGVSSNAVMDFTNNLGVLLRVGGTSAQEASGALLQLSQALGGSVVRAEEFNSMLEGAPAILQAAAIGIQEAEGSVSKLRNIMLEGRLSSRALFEGIRAGAPVMEKSLEGTASTTSQALTRLDNAFTNLARRFNENADAASAMGSVIDRVADTINEIDVSDAVEKITSITTALDNVITAFQTASRGATDFAHRFSQDTGLDGGAEWVYDNAPPWMRQLFDALGVESTAVNRRRTQALPGGVAPSAPGRGDRPRLTDRFAGLEPNVEVQIGEVVLPDNAISIEDYAVAGGDGNGKKTKLKSAPYTTARSFIGLREDRDNSLLKDALASQGINIDPAKVAWCAAFMNMVLKSQGLPGTGSLMARSFEDYGEATNNPRQGDIVVLKRGNNSVSGHVGFVEGFDENGNVRVLGGNQGPTGQGGVNVRTYNKNDVLGYRTVPGAERVSMADSISAEIERRNDASDAIREQDAAYREILQTGAQYVTQLHAEAAASTLTAEQASALRHEQDLLNAAQQAGITLTQDQKDQIKLLAEGMASAEVASKKLAETQAALSELAEGAFKGFAQDLLAGKSAAEAFEGVLGRIADKLLDMALDGLFQSLVTPSSGSGIGGFLSSIFGGGRAKGGDVSSRKAYLVGEKGPEIFAPGRTGTIIPNHRLPMTAPSVAAPNLKQSINISVQNNTGVEASARTEWMSDGSMKVILDRAIASSINTRGTETSNALRNGYGARQTLIRR